MNYFTRTNVAKLVEALRPDDTAEQIAALLLPYEEPPLEHATEQATPHISHSRFVDLMLDHGLMTDPSTQLPVLLQWLLGFSTHLMTTFMGLRLEHGRAISKLAGEIKDALKTGVHSRREALEVGCAELQEHLGHLNEESEALLGRPAQLQPGEWAPLGRIMKLLLHPDFAWDNFPETLPFRYMILRIDTVNGHAMVANGDGRPASITALEELCHRAAGTGRNPFLALQHAQMAQEQERQQTPQVLGPDGLPATPSGSAAPLIIP